jgi:hypothetical protein
MYPVDGYCFVGDQIESRHAITAPQIRRPTAFVAGLELAPLLNRLALGTVGE